MQYSTPELVLLGPAATLVLGVPNGIEDNGATDEQLMEGITAGLDD